MKAITLSARLGRRWMRFMLALGGLRTRLVQGAASLRCAADKAIEFRLRFPAGRLQPLPRLLVEPETIAERSHDLRLLGQSADLWIEVERAGAVGQRYVEIGGVHIMRQPLVERQNVAKAARKRLSTLA